MGERDQWRKLRDRQIEQRDPGKKERKLRTALPRSGAADEKAFLCGGFLRICPRS